MNSYVSTKFALLELKVRTLHVLKNNPTCYSYPPEIFRVGFDRTMYTVAESADSVEVCVNLTHPPDAYYIFDERITSLVFHNDDSIYTSVKIIKNEIRCRDDTVPKTVDTRSHCKVRLRACNNLPQPQKTEM